MEEDEFWQNELHIEQESEQQLRQKLAELQGGVRDCEAKLAEYLARIQVGLAPSTRFHWSPDIYPQMLTKNPKTTCSRFIKRRLHEIEMLFFPFFFFF